MHEIKPLLTRLGCAVNAFHMVSTNAEALVGEMCCA